MDKKRLTMLTDVVTAMSVVALVFWMERVFAPASSVFWIERNSFFACGLSMAWLGTMWFGLVRTWRDVEQVSVPAAWLTLLLLGCMAVMPYFSPMLGQWFKKRIIEVLYGGLVFGATGVDWLLHRLLQRDNPDCPALARHCRVQLVSMGLVLIGVALAVFVYTRAAFFGVLAATVWQFAASFLPEKAE